MSAAISPSQTVVVEQPIKALEKVEISTELNDIFNSFADVLDSLFNLLMGLHGQTNWSIVENNFMRCKLAKALGAKATENLNFRNLSSFIKVRQPKDAGHECESLIKLLHANVSALSSANESSEQMQSEYGSLKSVILSYFLLNDVLLGQVTGDEEIGKEKSELADLLDDFAEKMGTDLFVEFVEELRHEETDNIAFDESRTLLREQLNEFLRWKQSPTDELDQASKF